jgi:hypothetical protein
VKSLGLVDIGVVSRSPLQHHGAPGCGLLVFACDLAEPFWTPSTRKSIFWTDEGNVRNPLATLDKMPTRALSRAEEAQQRDQLK